MIPLHLMLAALFGWLEREQRDVIDFLREENRVLRAQLGRRRIRLNDDSGVVSPSSASVSDVDC